MNEFKEQMKERTRKAAVRALKICGDLPESTGLSIVKKQLMRCSTSVGANYRAACRGKSKADFINKMHIVEEECDESLYWLEIIEDLLEDNDNSIKSLHKEMDEIFCIVVSALKTTKTT